MEVNLLLKFLFIVQCFVNISCINTIYNTQWFAKNMTITSNQDGIKKAVRVSFINFIRIPNKMLLKKPIAWLTAPYVAQCRSKCSKHPMCISFNARRISDTVSGTTQLHCDFFDDDHYENQLFFLDVDDVDFYAPKDECNNGGCLDPMNPILHCIPKYKSNQTSRCKYGSLSDEFDISDLNGESKTVAVYPLVPPAWKHSFNLTVLAGAGDSNDMQCFISRFIKGAAFITIKVQAKKILFKILSLGYKSYPIQFDQTYSIEVELRYQGVSSNNPPQTEWNMEIKIDGAKFFEEVKTNLVNYNDVVYRVGFEDVYCKDNIRIQDLKFTPLFNEEHQVVPNYFPQELPNIENQLLLSFNMKLFAIDTHMGVYTGFVTLSASTGTLWKMLLDSNPTLSMNMPKISNSGITFPTLPNPLPLNEVMNMKLYQVYDTFHQKYMIEIRVNGTLIFSQGLNEQIPEEYTDVKITPTASIYKRSVKLSNFFVLSIP